MQDPWDRLAAPFPPGSHDFRVQELTPEGDRARLRPQLQYRQVVGRLDQEVGVGGWSNVFAALLGGALACSLTVAGTTKSAVVGPGVETDPERLSEDALVRAAELFGMRPAAEITGGWMPYDSEQGIPIPPEEQVVAAADEEAVGPETQPPDGEQEPIRPEAQRAIDRLVERLGAVGRGEEAARILVEYGGYGHDAEAARALYGRLRALLLKDETVP